MGKVSNAELEFNQYLDSLGYKFERNNRTILKQIGTKEYQAELDFWFPEQKIGIEFDGDYFHNNGKYNANQFVISCYNNAFMTHLLGCSRNNSRAIIKFAYSYDAGIFIYHVYEYEWKDKIKREKLKDEINHVLKNEQIFDLSKNKITIDAGKENYLTLLNHGYKIQKYNEPTLMIQRGKLKIYNCGTLTMIKNKKCNK